MSTESFDFALYKAEMLVDSKKEYQKWCTEIPFIKFPSNFIVKVIPPFNGAMIRFMVADEKYPENTVSVYLDCYDRLGIVGEPYWELYPYSNGDTYRCLMNDVDELVEKLIEAVNDKNNKIQKGE